MTILSMNNASLLRRLKGKIRRVWTAYFKRPYEKDPNFSTYWFNEVFRGQTAQVVQIGSNDGKTGDPLFRLLQKNVNWQALFVEPVPYLFERLRTNYLNNTSSTDRFSFARLAINEGEELPFYFVDPKAKEALPELPFWFDQLGSFDRNHLTRHLDGKLAPFIKEIAVEGIRLQGLFDRYAIKQIDILHIDTEGYDWKILSQLDLKNYQPAFILFEHHHLGEQDREAAINFLKTKYLLWEIGIDILAVHKTRVTTSTLQRMERHLNLLSQT